MVYRALTDDLISIGPPYFNAIFVPLMIILVVFLGIGPMSRWKEDFHGVFDSRFLRVFLASLFLGLCLPLESCWSFLWLQQFASV